MFNESLDSVRRYWDSRPCNIGHSNLEIGSRDYFIEVTKRRYFVEPHILEFMSLDRLQGKNVLELGCGIGTDGAKFAETGSKYFGIELSSESISLAAKRFNLFNLSGEFACIPIEDLQLDEFKTVNGKLFNLEAKSELTPDLVYSFGVLHHTPDPQYALQNIVKQVRIGTEFRIMLYSKHSYKAALIESGLDQYEAQDNCPIAYTYSHEDATKLINSSGLQVEHIWQDHIFPYSIEEYKKYTYRKLPWFEAMPPEIYRALKAHLGWHTLIIARKTYE